MPICLCAGAARCYRAMATTRDTLSDRTTTTGLRGRPLRVELGSDESLPQSPPAEGRGALLFEDSLSVGVERSESTFTTARFRGLLDRG